MPVDPGLVAVTEVEVGAGEGFEGVGYLEVVVEFPGEREGFFEAGERLIAAVEGAQ